MCPVFMAAQQDNRIILVDYCFGQNKAKKSRTGRDCFDAKSIRV
jgi:hypothetical protein